MRILLNTSSDFKIGKTTHFFKQEGNTVCEIDKLKIYDKELGFFKIKLDNPYSKKDG